PRPDRGLAPRPGRVPRRAAVALRPAHTPGTCRNLRSALRSGPPWTGVVRTRPRSGGVCAGREPVGARRCARSGGEPVRRPAPPGRRRPRPHRRAPCPRNRAGRGGERTPPQGRRQRKRKRERKRERPGVSALGPGGRSSGNDPGSGQGSGRTGRGETTREDGGTLLQALVVVLDALPAFGRN